MTSAKVVAAVRTIQELLEDDRAIIVDTETTGLGVNSEVVQLGAINMKGDVLFNQYFMPVGEISKEATAANGITRDLLIQKDAKTFTYWQPDIEDLLTDRSIAAYNRTFDFERLSRYIASLDRDLWHCIMLLRQRIEGQRKPLGGNHDAIGDCSATLRLMNELAKIDTSDIVIEDESDLKAWAERQDQLRVKRLAIEKEEKLGNEILLQAIYKFCPDDKKMIFANGKRKVEVSRSVREVQLKEGVSFDKFGAAYPEFVKTKIEGKGLKERILQGDMDDYLDYGIGESIAFRKA
jgi:DNA polymerase III epsilon subunit-like protein